MTPGLSASSASGRQSSFGFTVEPSVGSISGSRGDGDGDGDTGGTIVCDDCDADDAASSLMPLYSSA